MKQYARQPPGVFHKEATMRPKYLLLFLGILSGICAALILINPLFLILCLGLLLSLLLFAMKVLNDSQTDTLTGVSNLRKLANLRTHYHHIRQLTVIYLDINELKQRNDKQGHEAGNQALKEVAHFMLQVAGSAGRVYRIGGDEFILISEGPQGSALLQKWESKIAHMHHVGFSYGSATGAGRNLESLVQEAEKNMYTMKRNTPT